MLAQPGVLGEGGRGESSLWASTSGGGAGEVGSLLKGQQQQRTECLYSRAAAVLLGAQAQCSREQPCFPLRVWSSGLSGACRQRMRTCPFKGGLEAGSSGARKAGSARAILGLFPSGPYRAAGPQGNMEFVPRVPPLILLPTPIMWG